MYAYMSMNWINSKWMPMEVLYENIGGDSKMLITYHITES